MDKIEQAVIAARQSVAIAYDLVRGQYDEYNREALLKALDIADSELCKASIYAEVARER